MSVYVPQGFTSGQMLKAEQLNYIEEGIAKILPVIEGSNQQLIVDGNGKLVWEEKAYGYTFQEELLLSDI